MTDSNVGKKDHAPDAMAEAEDRLLAATHDLAEILGVEPQQALRALASMVQRRVDFERMKGAALASSDHDSG